MEKPGRRQVLALDEVMLRQQWSEDDRANLRKRTGIKKSVRTNVRLLGPMKDKTELKGKKALPIRAEIR